MALGVNRTATRIRSGVRAPTPAQPSPSTRKSPCAAAALSRSGVDPATTRTLSGALGVPCAWALNASTEGSTATGTAAAAATPVPTIGAVMPPGISRMRQDRPAFCSPGVAGVKRTVAVHPARGLTTQVVSTSVNPPWFGR